METPRLDKFRDMIVKFASDNELDMADIAAALTYENQKDRPLFPKLDNIVAPRPERQNKKAENKPKKERKLRDEDGKVIPMITYRLEVGKNDSVEPSNIVGAIANEADISSQYIGQIKLYDSYSTVDLPEGMPNEVFKHLKKVRVRGNPLNISLLGDTQNTEALSDSSEATGKRVRKSKKDNKKAAFAKQNSKKNRNDRAPIKKKKTSAKKNKKQQS
jgi:ATP-dependent RNA helicase DeaD